MLTHARKVLTAPVLIFAVLTTSFAGGLGKSPVGVTVQGVIDGDTIQISGGDRVRLLGIDAPERGEPLSELSTERLRELVSSGKVFLEICEDRDAYGRLLATVRTGGTNVNAVLLQEGLALPLLIPPCGEPVAVNILKAAALGALAQRGLYSPEGYRIVPHSEADKYVGQNVIVRGRILNIHRGQKAWHLNFGKDWKTDFTAVLFEEGRRRYREMGIDPADLAGSEVLVIGSVKRYNGPEIIIRGPHQIIPLEGKIIRNPGPGGAVQ